MNDRASSLSPGTSRFRTELWAALGVGLVFLALSFLFYRISMRTVILDTREAEGSLSQELALGVRSMIEARTRALEMWIELDPKVGEGTKASLSRNSATAMRHLPGLYALTWVNAKGEIHYVYPEAQNQRALGKNLLENPQVANYLRAVRATGLPQLTHVFRTYQGIDTFVIYLPLIADGKFLGWLSVVLDHRTWLGEFLRARNYADLYFRICWEKVPGNCYELGTRSLPMRENSTPYRFTVMNQPLVVESLIRNPQAEARARSLGWIFSLLVASVAILLAWIVRTALLNHRRWLRSVSLVRLRGATVQALLSELGPCAQELEGLAKTRDGLGDPESEKLSRMSGRQKRLIADVRQMQAIAQDHGTMLFTECYLLASVKKVIEEFTEELRARGVRIEFDAKFAELPKVVVDRALLESNVLRPLLEGAIGVSERDEQILLLSRVTRSSVILEIRLTRRWPTLHQVSTSPESPENSGTEFKSELWTLEALGLLQAILIMVQFKGDFTYHAGQTHASICLEFRRSRDVPEDRET